jgi:hypothetical protein
LRNFISIAAKTKEAKINKSGSENYKKNKNFRFGEGNKWCMNLILG